MSGINAKIQISALLALFLVMLLLFVPLSIGEGSPINQTSNYTNYTLDFSEIYQESITLETPVTMFQTLLVTNQGSQELNQEIHLQDYPVAIQPVYLEEAQSIVVSVNGEDISTTSTFTVVVAPGESKEYIISYTFSPVHKEVICEDKTIQDLLPQDATVLASDLPLDTLIQQTCTVRIYHDGNIHYYDINVPLDELDPSTITSIYYVEGETHLRLEDGNLITLTQ